MDVEAVIIVGGVLAVVLMSVAVLKVLLPMVMNHTGLRAVFFLLDSENPHSTEVQLHPSILAHL